MFLAPVLLFLAAILTIGLTLAFATSLVLGMMLAKGNTPSPLVVLFLFAIPSAAVCAAVGAVVVGYFATQADEYAIVWGPMVGLIGGGVLGGGMGAVAGVAWSRRRQRLAAGVSGV